MIAQISTLQNFQTRFNSASEWASLTGSEEFSSDIFDPLSEDELLEKEFGFDQIIGGKRKTPRFVQVAVSFSKQQSNTFFLSYSD